MKRTFTIKVEVNDEVVQGKSFARVCGEGRHQVYLEPDDRIPAYAVFAHEVGHIIGAEFRLPKSFYDYRLQTGVVPSSVEIGPLVVASENEAWDLAEIALRVRDARTYAVGTYESFYTGKFTPPVFYPYNK